MFFIHSSADGQLVYFHVVPIVKCAAVNIGVHVSFLIMFFSGNNAEELDCRVVVAMVLVF